MTLKDRAWLAGIIEGEGYIGFNRNTYKRKVYVCPVTEVGMQDRDVIQLMAHLFGKKVLGPYGPYGTMAKKPSYQAQVFSKNAIKVLRIILPFLGKRRTKAAYRCLRRKSTK